MRNYNTILIEKQQQYHLYHQVKNINMNILLVKKYEYLTGKDILPSNQQQILE